MLKAEILSILNDLNFWKKEIDTGILREACLQQLRELANLNEIIVVTGARRTGKSTLLLQYCKELIKNGTEAKDILIINFEDPRWKELNTTLLNHIYEIYLTELNPNSTQHIILDEIQAITGWEKFARYLHETKKTKVFVTGSSSKLLSSEYASILAGRHIDMQVFPLSFQELLDFNAIKAKNQLDITAKRHQIQRLFTEYLAWGGFPKIALTKTESGKRELLATYFRDIIIKDIAQRYKIKEIDKLEELAKYYLTNISSIQSLNKTRNVLKLNLDTVERFSYYLSYTYAIYFIKKFAYSKKEQIANPKKVYAIDTGIRNSVAFMFSKDLGKLAENIAFLSLQRQSKEIYYWKDRKQREIDFVIKEGINIKQLIQVCWNVDSAETKERETASLINASKELKCSNLLIITEDTETEEKIEGKTIKYVPLWKWLLEENTTEQH